MEAVFFILALLSFIVSVAMLIGNAINRGLGVLLTWEGTKRPVIFFAFYIVFYVIFLIIENGYI
ncbi:hypothetical protein BAMA_03775 [Bacillus manliponensis]|uniref:Mas-related G-protein coupled receptor member D n=1 Tax=Bacillus manliponensis TaxID=574376 RepID=A0A073JWJ7_9BACI|nr:hypothetical protein [Bacillus manliponensis]KEK18636.1 hypothetical protein BAMA_03775 [Bacillus manliponensis]